MPEPSYWYLGVSPFSVPYWSEVTMCEVEVGGERVVAPMLFTEREKADSELRRHEEVEADAYLQAVQRYPSIPVMVMSTIEDVKLYERFQQAGASEVLGMGITYEEILAAVRRPGMGDRDDVTMRVLIAYKDSHRSYGQTMAGALRGLRPTVEATIVQVRELGAEVGRFDPHLVICNRPNTVDPGGRLAWVRLSDEPEEPSEFCLAGQRWGSENTELEEVLKSVDETERLLRERRDLGGC